VASGTAAVGEIVKSLRTCKNWGLRVEYFYYGRKRRKKFDV